MFLKVKECLEGTMYLNFYNPKDFKILQYMLFIFSLRFIRGKGGGFVQFKKELLKRCLVLDKVSSIIDFRKDRRCEFIKKRFLEFQRKKEKTFIKHSDSNSTGKKRKRIEETMPRKRRKTSP